MVKLKLACYAIARGGFSSRIIGAGKYPLCCRSFGWANCLANAEKNLSARRLFNREALQRIQEELSQYLKENGFDVERGNKNTERKIYLYRNTKPGFSTDIVSYC